MRCHGYMRSLLHARSIWGRESARIAIAIKQCDYKRDASAWVPIRLKWDARTLEQFPNKRKPYMHQILNLLPTHWFKNTVVLDGYAQFINFYSIAFASNLIAIIIKDKNNSIDSIAPSAISKLFRCDLSAIVDRNWPIHLAKYLHCVDNDIWHFFQTMSELHPRLFR